MIVNIVKRFETVLFDNRLNECMVWLKNFLTLKGHGHDIGENYFSKLNAWLHCISTKAFLNRQSKFEIFFFKL